MTSSGKPFKGFTARPSILPPAPVAPRAARIPIPVVRFGATVQAKAPPSHSNAGHRAPPPPPIRWPGQGGPLQRAARAVPVASSSPAPAMAPPMLAAMLPPPPVAVVVVAHGDPAWLKAFIADFATSGIKGVKSFVDAARGSSRDFAALAGYKYQAECAKSMMATLAEIEREFAGTYSPTRRVDLVTQGGKWIECKCYDLGKKSSEAHQRQFFSQALDYAVSHGAVDYRFKHGTPPWARDYLGCINIWANANLTVSDIKPTIQKFVRSTLDDMANVKAAKAHYRAVTGNVAPPLAAVAAPSSGVAAASLGAAAAAAAGAPTLPRAAGTAVADGMFSATLADLRRMEQTADIADLAATLDALIRKTRPAGRAGPADDDDFSDGDESDGEEMDEPYYYYGRIKW